MIDTLSELFAMRGVPRHIRSDNGPEFIAPPRRRWLKLVGVGTLHIEPGSPWEDGYAESFHGRLRDEFLAMEIFEGVRDARALTALGRDEYNTQRPHNSLGYQPRPGSPPRVRLSPRPRPWLKPHTRPVAGYPVSKPSYPLVQEIQPGQSRASSGATLLAFDRAGNAGDRRPLLRSSP